MMSGIGSTSSNSAYLSRMLSRLDSDTSGSISKDEFVAGRPEGSSADQSGKLYDALDSSGTGAMSLSGLSSAFQQMSSQMQATMLQAQEGRGQGHGADKMFSELDSNGDASLSKEEFLAGKPEEVSDAQAESLWTKIAGDEADSVSQQQFAEGIKAAGPPPGGPPPGGGAPGGGASEDSTDAVSALDTNGDGIVSQAEYRAGHPEAEAVGQDQATTSDELVQKLLAAIDTYRNSSKTADHRNRATAIAA